jgi:hypothetical protein
MKLPTKAEIGVYLTTLLGIVGLLYALILGLQAQGFIPVADSAIVGTLLLILAAIIYVVKEVLKAIQNGTVTVTINK